MEKIGETFQEPRWRLGSSTPLTVAILATAVTAARWNEKYGVCLADGLHLAMRGSVDEDFDAVAKRLMKSMEEFDTTLFRVTETVGAGLKCYEMSDEQTCRRIISYAATVYGASIADFVDDVARTFKSMRVFITQADEARRLWDAKRLAH
jgi:hypothetical protein